MLKRLDILVDGYIDDEGFHIMVNEEEETITYFKLVNDFIESRLVPSHPPSIRQDGKDAIFKLSLMFEALAGYMRKKIDEYPDWQPKKDSMGYRD